MNRRSALRSVTSGGHSATSGEGGSTWPRPRGEVPRRILGHVVLLIGAVISVFPFYWMIVRASNRTEDILTYPPKLVPGDYLMENIQTVLAGVPFWKPAWLSLVTAVLLTLLVLFFDSLAAFTFAKYQSRPRTCCS